MKARWNLVIAVGALAALALPGAPALAGGPHGDDMGHGARHGAFVWHNRHRGDDWSRRDKHHGERGKHQSHRLWQFEGVVASFDGTTLVLHPRFSNAISATVAVSSSTVIVAAQGISATLAAGEQVHVQATRNPDGSFTAVRIRIQRGGEPNGTPEATETPEATQTDQATATPTAATGTATPTATVTPPTATATPTS